MPQKSYRVLTGIVMAAMAGIGAACGADSSPSSSRAVPPSSSPTSPPTSAPTSPPTPTLAPSGAAPGALGAGPLTVVALGDSLTAGDGDNSGRGYVGRLTRAIAAEPGRKGSSSVNLGQSGWTSQALVDGEGDAPPQLTQGVDEVRRATAGDRAVLVTVLIGSNDLWRLYDNTPKGTSPDDEDAAVATYRKNLDRTVRELQDAGAVVVVGLPDDQTLRPGASDLDRLHDVLPNVTADEIGQMSRLAERFDRTAEEVAAARAVLTVDTNGSFWADRSKMADDGIHPNGAGYSELAELWMAVVASVL